ncbi:hypothetical protein G6F50_014624 [Rhizopus delemar]|uniref:Uncharacterized protein n=1 Tax=Rhizopus delemar TaxID=936053 RepID=A0A9P6Y3T6_9FUNG|nr:hypothetical protein G6F50_014624 [Rhizopus delemar]
MPAAQFARRYRAPLSDAGRGTRRMVDEHQRRRDQPAQVGQRCLHLLFAIAAAVQWLAAAEVPLGDDQLLAFLRAGRDDQRGVLAGRHIEFHAVELDHLRDIGARLQQRGISVVAGDRGVAGATVVGVDHPAQAEGPGLCRGVAAAVGRVATTHGHGRRGSAVPVHAPFAVHMVVAGQPLAASVVCRRCRRRGRECRGRRCEQRQHYKILHGFTSEKRTDDARTLAGPHAAGAWMPA